MSQRLLHRRRRFWSRQTGSNGAGIVAGVGAGILSGSADVLSGAAMTAIFVPMNGEDGPLEFLVSFGFRIPGFEFAEGGRT